MIIVLGLAWQIQLQDNIVLESIDVHCFKSLFSETSASILKMAGVISLSPMIFKLILFQSF